MSAGSRHRSTRAAAIARVVVAENLIDARLSAGLSQKEAAKRFCGRSQATLSRIESAALDVTVGELVALGAVYAVPFSRLVEGI